MILGALVGFLLLLLYRQASDQVEQDSLIWLAPDHLMPSSVGFARLAPFFWAIGSGRNSSFALSFRPTSQSTALASQWKLI